jgi:hypothetical protein
MLIVNLAEVKEMCARLSAQVTKATLNDMMLKLQLAPSGKTNKEMMEEIKGQLDDWEEMLEKEEKEKDEEKKGKGEELKEGEEEEKEKKQKEKKKKKKVTDDNKKGTASQDEGLSNVCFLPPFFLFFFDMKLMPRLQVVRQSWASFSSRSATSLRGVLSSLWIS